MKPVIFAFVLASGLGLFTWTVARFFTFMAVGRPGIPLDHIPARIGSVLIYWLGQKKVMEKPMDSPKPGFTSKHHLFIFWGFLIVTVGTVELWLNGLTGLDLSSLLPIFVYQPLRWAIDAFNLIVLLMIGFGFFRRLVVKPRLIPMSLDAALILSAIALLMITHFLFNGFRLAAAGQVESYSPVSSVVAGWFAGIDRGLAHKLSDGLWWVHVSLGLAFVNYVPYSKHIHIVGALPNIFFRNLGQRGAMPKLNLEDENDWGVGKIEQFTQKSLMDQYACTECARCSNFCPAFNTDKPLSPMKLIHDLRDEMLENGKLRHNVLDLERRIGEQDALSKDIAGGGDQSDGHAAGTYWLRGLLAQAKAEYDALPPLVGGRIHDDTLWACTTCGACQEVCPVFIDHPLKILQMRTHLVLTESRMPSELARTFTNLEKNSNPWGIAAEKRMDWAEGLVVPTLADHPKPEYLLFVGCAGAFDDRIKKTMRALVEVLHAAEVQFAVLGKQEQCSGDAARRAGNEYLFQSQAEANVTAMNEGGVTKVVASCPHCFHTIKNEYPQFGGEFEVIHHSQLLAHLLKVGKLKPDGAGPSGIKKFTYHDSCYLGRWNGEYNAPREILKGCNKGEEVIELKRNKEHGFCCGGGGGRMWMEEHGPRVNNNRAEEILASGADAVAVACPFCTIMITDGVKAKNAEERMQVLDVAEVIAKSLKRIRPAAETATPAAPAPAPTANS